MSTASKKALVANIFGTFGYISCLLQWLFVALLYLPLLLDNKQFKEFLIPQQIGASTPMVTTGPPSPILIGFAVVFTVLMLILTIVIVLRAPVSIAKGGKKVTTVSANTITPLVMHRELPAAKKRLLTQRIIKMTKLGIIVVPVLLCMLSLLLTTALPAEVSVFIGALLAIGSLVWFSIQYIIARLFRIPLQILV
jgi:hypothetical protein